MEGEGSGIIDRPRTASAPVPSEPSVAVRSPRDPHHECEKLGVVEALLGAERYGSVLEIGCGDGALARRLLPRCERYCGMEADVAALARARGTVPEGRFVPLTVPFRLPPGPHELVVLSEVLPLLDAADLRRLALALGAHAPCREILVVAPLGDGDGAGGGSARGGDGFERFAGSLAGRFEPRELAVRRRYRVDALLARDRRAAEPRLV